MRAVTLYGTLGALVMTAAAVAPASGTSPAPPATQRPTKTPATTGASGDGALTDLPPLPRAAAPEARGAALAAAAAAATGIHWRACPAEERLPAPVECGTVSVPVDYARPGGEKIRLTVSRARATGPAEQRQGPLVHNPGGPGGNGMPFPLLGPAVGDDVWKKINTRYDLVGYAPRGVGRSAPLSCQDPARFTRRPNPAPRVPSAADKRALRAGAKAYARGCARAQGERLDHYTTPDNARDLDVLRAALGQRRLNFFGVSYGSYLGTVYAALYPDHVRRLVLDSVVDPSPEKIWYRSNLEQNTAFQRRWQDWKAWVARHHAVYGLGSRPREVQRHFDAVRKDADRGRAGAGTGARELLAGYLRVGYDEAVWPEYAAALSAYRKGDRLAVSALVAPRTDAATARREENTNAVYNAVQCADAPWPRDWSVWDRDNTALARTAPFNTWENARMNLPCAYWPGAHAQPLDVRSAPGELPPVLLVAATRDAATPYGGALETRRRLAGSVLVTEKGAGTHGVTGGNACVDRHVTRYLLDGRTPDRDAECAARPLPRAEATGRQGT